jgi:hypothetical protein
MTRWGSTPSTGPEREARDAQPARTEVRLRMRSHPATQGLDGAWWPRSRDAEAEFPELVLVTSSWVGPVRRVTYHVDDWDAAGPEVNIDGWLVELVASATLEPHTVLVAGTNERQRSLLVVPAGVPGSTARAVLRAMADTHGVVSAGEMLANLGVQPADEALPKH